MLFAISCIKRDEIIAVLDPAMLVMLNVFTVTDDCRTCVFSGF